MKIDKKNVRHWLYLFTFTFNVLMALLVLPFVRKVPGRLVLYGHKLNGNLAAIYKYGEEHKTDFEIYFLALDPAYYRSVREDGIRALSALKWADVLQVCKAQAVVTDHGPLSLFFLNKLTSTFFVDVWHGIPFKGFDRGDFAYMRGYDAVFVTSNSMKEMYYQKYGFRPEQVYVTGYARTDKLTDNKIDVAALREKYRLAQEDRKIVMFAPTWHHDSPANEKKYFGLPAVEFIQVLRRNAKNLGVLFLIRFHLNADVTYMEDDGGIRFVPVSDAPDTEELLLLSDVLISDWSSIVFDYLLLQRPTMFLDTEPPFKKGFSYGPEVRFGPIVNSIEQFLSVLSECVTAPDNVTEHYAAQMGRTRQLVYDDYADGKSANRCVARIGQLLS